MDGYYEDRNRCEIRLESTVDGEMIERIRTVVDSIPGAELVGVTGLEKMAERNRKEFGDGPLDCCDLPKE